MICIGSSKFRRNTMNRKSAAIHLLVIGEVMGILASAWPVPGPYADTYANDHADSIFDAIAN